MEIGGGEIFTLADIKAMGIIKHIWCTDTSTSTRNLVLRIYWDFSEIPSVEVPLGDFFASADKSSLAQISSIPVCVNPANAYNSYWEMPFRHGFKITLENLQSTPVTVYYRIDFEETEIDDKALYFHAQFRRKNPLPYKENFIILDTIKGTGKDNGGYDSICEAAQKMARVSPYVYHPIPENVEIYNKLYKEYKTLHDYFGRGENDVMKRICRSREKNI